MANQIGNSVLEAPVVFARLDEFDDSDQVMDIIEVLNKEGGLSIRANACQGTVTFFNEDFELVD